MSSAHWKAGSRDRTSLIEVQLSLLYRKSLNLRHFGIEVQLKIEVMPGEVLIM